MGEGRIGETGNGELHAAFAANDITHLPEEEQAVAARGVGSAAAGQESAMPVVAKSRRDAPRGPSMDAVAIRPSKKRRLKPAVLLDRSTEKEEDIIGDNDNKIAGGQGNETSASKVSANEGMRAAVGRESANDRDNEQNDSQRVLSAGGDSGKVLFSHVSDEGDSEEGERPTTDSVSSKKIIPASEREKSPSSPPFSADWLASLDTSPGPAYTLATQYMQTTAADILGDSFSSQLWNSTMLRVEGYGKNREIYYKSHSPYAAGMLRIGRELATRWEIGGDDPFMQALAGIIFKKVEEEKRDKKGSSGTVYQMTEEQKGKISDAEPSERSEIIKAVLEEVRQQNQIKKPDEQKEQAKAMSEGLDEFVQANDMQKLQSVLDDLAQIPLINAHVREDRINEILENEEVAKMMFQYSEERKDFKERQAILAPEIVEILGIDSSHIIDIENGQSSTDLHHNIDASREAGISSAAIEEQDGLQRGQDWLRTLGQEGMTIGKAIDYLRLERGMTMEAFEELCGIGKNIITVYKSGRKHPRWIQLQKILERNKIDPSSKEGRRFNLLRARIDPLSFDDFARSTPGMQARYLRVQNALTQQQQADETLLADTTISGKESGDHPMTKKDIIVYATNQGIDTESVLIRIMLQRAEIEAMKISEEERAERVKTIVVSEEDRLELFRGKVLFKEHLPIEKQPYYLTAEEKEIEERVLAIDTAGSILGFLRDNRGLNKKQLSQKTGVDADNITDIESGKAVPKEFIVMKLMVGINSLKSENIIHHPFLQHILHLAEQERRLSHEDKALFKEIIAMRQRGEKVGGILAYIRDEKGISEAEMKGNADLEGIRPAESETGDSIMQKQTVIQFMRILGYEQDSLLVEAVTAWARQELEEKQEALSIG